MPKAKKRDFAAMARAWAATGTWKDALLAGGYTEAMAARGQAAMSNSDREKFEEAKKAILGKRLGKFVDLGERVTADQQEKLVRGALLANVAQGKDKATASLKMLGSDKRVAMFQPDSVTGVMVIQMPPEFSLGGRLDPEAFAAKLPEAQLTSSKPPELIDRRGGGCGWDNNFKAPAAPEAPKDR